jgi:hypothetical protein
MALLFPDQGENMALEMIVNKTAPQSLVLRLFSNNVTPGESDTEATYTECSGSGYAAINLTGATWGAAAAGSIAYAEQTFTFNAALTAYGYYITQVTSGKLLYAERFSDAPHTWPSGGGTQKITPTITAA